MPASGLASREPEIHARIKKLAEGRLRSHPHLALKNICCVYQNGLLSLRGCLPTYYLKRLAQEAVADLEGVDRTDNQIQVVAPTFRSR